MAEAVKADLLGTKTQVNIKDFSKYTGNEAPNTYLARFEAEAKAMGVPETRYPSIFPSMMSGVKACAAVTILQQQVTWNDMKQEFIKYFSVDVETVISELKTLRCNEYELEQYIAKFN